jgi:hypothetical protein
MPTVMAGDVDNKMVQFFESLKFDNWAPRSARAWGKGDYLNLSKALPKQNGGGGGLLTEQMMKQIQEEELNRGSLVEGGDARQQEMAQAFMQRVSTLDDDMVKKRPATYSIKDRADELNAEDYFSLENALQNDEFVLDGEALAILCYNK